MLPDGTILIQLSIYLTFLLVIYLTTFRPVLKILDERDRRTSGALQDADDKLTAFQEMETQYINKIEDAKRKYFDEKTRRIQAAAAAAEKLRENAKDELERFVVAARADIEKETQGVRIRLGQSKDTLKSEILRKLSHG